MVDSVADELSVAIQQVKDGSAIIHTVANGPDTDVVQTNSGPLPTLSKWFKDKNESVNIYLDQKIDAVIGPVQANADSAAASASTATTAAQAANNSAILAQDEAAAAAADSATATSAASAAAASEAAAASSAASAQSSATSAATDRATIEAAVADTFGAAVPLGVPVAFPSRAHLAAQGGAYVALDGQLVNRTALSSGFLALLTGGTLPVVSEASWTGTIANRASYTLGNGSTTVRFPDLNGKSSGGKKALFLRGDGSSAPAAGIIQDDDFKSHSHTAQLQSPSGVGTFPIFAAGSATDSDTLSVGATGGSETRPVNTSVVWAVRVLGLAQTPVDLEAEEARDEAVVAKTAAEAAQAAAEAAETGAEQAKLDAEAALSGLEADITELQTKSGRIVMVLDHANADAAALAAYQSGSALMLWPGQSAKLVCNPTAGDDIQAMAKWIGQCFVAPNAELYIEVSGPHTISSYIDVENGNGPTLDIRGPSSPDFLQITGISFSAVSGSLYQATVTVSSALPSTAVVGGPIGLQNVKDDLDAEVINGCQIIKSIAGDRLSFTFDFYSPAGAPTIGTALDNTLTDGLVANQVVVFKGALICQSTGWDGTSREGFINVLNGGRVTLRNIGLAYSGAASTEHDLVFARGAGSRVYAYDRVGFAGAGDKVLRSYGGAEFFLNRSYLGGAGKALELFQGVAGGNNQFVRTSSGGALTAGFTCGHASTVNFAQAALVGCGIGLRTTTAGAIIAAYPARIAKCSTAILATQGEISGTTATVIERCTLGVDWAGGGTVVGNFTFGTAGKVNSSNSVKPANTWHNGGIWYGNTALNGEFENLTINSSTPDIYMKDGLTTCKVSGDGGHLTLMTHSTSRNIEMRTATTLLATMSGANTGGFTPGSDNQRPLGSGAMRWSEVFAGAGAINTSDAREKTPVRALVAAEIEAARQMAKEIGVFRFLNSVEAKGDAAREHIGMTVQRAMEIMQANGLDPLGYAFICHDEWDDIWIDHPEQSVPSSEDPELMTVTPAWRELIQPAGDRYGFRMDQLIAFIAAGFEARLSALENADADHVSKRKRR